MRAKDSRAASVRRAAAMAAELKPAEGGQPTLSDEAGKDGPPGSVAGSLRRDQRPTVVRVGRLPGVSVVVDLRRGSMSARSWSKPSAAARPAVASSQRA